MANYGEYSGAPSETQTFEYAKTILKLMTEGEPHPEGKILFLFPMVVQHTQKNCFVFYVFTLMIANNFDKIMMFRKSADHWWWYCKLHERICNIFCELLF